MPIVTASAGDCISSIATEHGFAWETVWEHGSNAALRRLRKSPNVLQPGDEVFVPAFEQKTEQGATQQRHCFRMKGVPARLRLRITHELLPQGNATPPPAQPVNTLHIDDGDPPAQDVVVDPTPRANTPFVLVVDERRHEGSTDGDGRIDVPIWPAARNATLTLNPGQADETVLAIELGHLDPDDSVAGIKQRLQNLGYPCGENNNDDTAGFQAALRAYQHANGLQPTGRADGDTMARLRDRHGS